MGILLSGGLDSAAILEAHHRLRGPGLPAYCIAVEDSVDERPLARETAAHFGSELREIVLPAPTLADVASMVRSFGEPFADASALPFSAVVQAASEDVKVVLTGDGGDELLAGYDRHLIAATAMRPAVRILARLAAPFASPRRRAKLRAIAASGAMGIGERMLQLQACAGAEALHDLLDPELVRTSYERARKGHEALAAEWPDIGPRARAVMIDRDTQLVTDLLVKTDRGSMAHGVEVRSPFLDAELERVAIASMRADVRFPPPRKQALRRYLSGRIPHSVLNAPKRGLGVPLESWLQGPLGDEVRDLLASQACRERGFLRVDGIDSLWTRLESGEGLAAELLYASAVVELWWSGIDGNGLAVP